jgi:phosphate transport system permease protein
LTSLAGPSTGGPALVGPGGPPGLASPKRRWADQSFAVAALGCGLLVLAILIGIVVATLSRSWPAIRYEGFRFITSKTWDPANGKLGGLSLIYGTLVTSIIALVAAVPVSIGIALFITELAPRRARTPIVFIVDLLAAVPSVVFGLWGFETLSAPIGRFYGHISNGVSSVPVLNTFLKGSQGRSYMTAGLIVALMITPIITSLSREVFATVPATQKEAALALGATRWEMIRASILGYSRNGVVGSIMLGLGRAMGETIAVALVIGSVQQVSAHLFTAGDALAAVIANQFGEATNQYGASGKVPFQAALIGLGFALFVITIIVNLLARSFIARGERHVQGT